MIPFAVPFLLQASPAFSPPDAELRDAQARFESVRRQHLAVEYGSGGRCEARIGRFCYWYDSAPPPPERPESPRIVAARASLLDRLTEAAERWPSDAWIAGQRVRYLIDAGNADSAALLSCSAAAWWCASLRGLALHVRSRGAAADSAFSIAMEAMPPGVRCEWTNLAIVVEDPLDEEFERADCARRSGLAHVAWRVMQPLWMLPGNDARAEHLSRLTMATILAGSATPHATRWGDDMRELLIRYGWAERYTRSPPSGIDAARWSVTGHDREPNWNLAPRVASLGSPWIARDAWSLRMPFARMRYAPRQLVALRDLPHQLVRVPRADSMEIIVSGVRAGALGDSATAALAVLRDGELHLLPMHASAASVTVPADTAIVSVEALAAGGRAARARYSVAPLACQRAALCLSDLLLYAGSSPETLSGALAQAIVDSVPAAAPLGVWWHLRGAPTALTLTATVQSERSVARRAIERLRLASRGTSTRIRWKAVLPGDTTSMQVTLHLPERARGRHRITLTAQAAGSRAVTSTRTVVVVP